MRKELVEEICGKPETEVEAKVAEARKGKPKTKARMIDTAEAETKTEKLGDPEE